MFEGEKRGRGDPPAEMHHGWWTPAANREQASINTIAHSYDEPIAS